MVNILPNEALSIRRYHVSLPSLLALRRFLALTAKMSWLSISGGRLKGFSARSGKGCPNANLALPRRCFPTAASRRYGFE